MEAEKNKNVVVSGVWPVGREHFHTLPLDAYSVDKLLAHIGHGAKILIRKRSEATLATAKNKAPYYLEIVPKEEVEAFEARKQLRTGSKQSL